MHEPVLAMDRMSQAEVSLRLAMFLIEQGKSVNTVDVFVDGAQIRTGQTVHFQLREFMFSKGWNQCLGDGWQTHYSRLDMPASINVHSRHGMGDVSTVLVDGRVFLGFASKGTLGRSKSSQEYGALRSCIGQLMTTERDVRDAVLAVAVPSTDKFEHLAQRWRKAPLIEQAGFLILTVDRNDVVKGW